MKIHVALVLAALTGFVASASSEEQNTPVQVAPTAPNPVLEVAKMAEAGVSEKTILAYVEMSPSVAVTGDDIVLLHKRGVSDKVITAMLLRSPLPVEAELASTSAPPAPTAATVATSINGPNPPIIYPTPVREITPLMRPFTVYAAPYDYYYYGASSVIISGSPYCSPVPSFYGGGFGRYGGFPSYGGGYPAYAGGYRSYGWGGSGGSGWGCRGNGWGGGRCRF